MPAARCSARIARRTFPESPGYHEKFYFSPGDTGFKVWRDALRHDRRRDLLGPMVPGVGARDGAARRGDPVLSDGDRLGAAGSEHRFARSLAARDAGPRGLATSCRWSLPTASAPSRASAGKSRTTARRSSPITRARSLKQAPRDRRSDRHRDVRSRRDPRLSHGVGRVPRSPAGAVRADHDARRSARLPLRHLSRLTRTMQFLSLPVRRASRT